ncbi:hypothetical protein ACFL5O_09795, partial [Myxococcota bacterium]
RQRDVGADWMPVTSRRAVEVLPSEGRMKCCHVFPDTTGAGLLAGALATTTWRLAAFLRTLRYRVRHCEQSAMFQSRSGL